MAEGKGTLPLEDENPFAFEEDDEWADAAMSGSAPAADIDELWAEPDWGAPSVGEHAVQSASDEVASGARSSGSPKSTGAPPQDASRQGHPEQEPPQQPEAAPTQQEDQQRQCEEPSQPPAVVEAPATAPPPEQEPAAAEPAAAPAAASPAGAEANELSALVAAPPPEQEDMAPPEHAELQAPPPEQQQPQQPQQQLFPAPEPETESQEQPHKQQRDAPVTPEAAEVPGEEHDGQEQQEQDQRQQSAGGSGGGAAAWGGWGAGWGFNVLGGTLRAVAAGAVRDVRELTGSLHQALAEVQDRGDSDDEEQQPLAAAAQGGGAQQRPQPAQADGPAVAATAATAGRLPASPPPPTPELPLPHAEPESAAEEMTPAPVATSPGPEAAHRPPEVQPEADRSSTAVAGVEGEDASGEASGLSDLDEVDQRIEQLATGAAKALSSLWGGLSGVARNTATLVSKVEAATLGIAKDLVSGAGVTQDVQQLQSAAASGVRGVAALSTRLEAGLETVGRTALGLLEEATGQHRAAAAAAAARGGEAPAASARPGGTQRSFEELFYLYGGQQLAEDLENLANECARIANKARARLEDTQQAELDTWTALLGPLFSAPLMPAAGDAAAQEAAASDDDDGAAARAAQEQLEQRYEPVRFLCQDSATRAQGFQQLLLAAALEEEAQRRRRRGQGEGIKGTDAAATAAATTADGAAAGGEQAGAGATPAPGGSRGGVADEEGEEEEKEDESLLRAALLQVRGHMFKRLAELATAQLQLLLDHGVNLAAPARTTDIPVGSSIAWPESALSQARLLQRQARLMARDVDEVARLYSSALQAALDQAGADAAPAPAGAAAPADAGAEGEWADEAAVVEGEARQACWVGEEDLELCRQALQQLRSARGMASGALEEAFRGLLYPVLVRELVQRIAGGADEREQGEV